MSDEVRIQLANDALMTGRGFERRHPDGRIERIPPEEIVMHLPPGLPAWEAEIPGLESENDPPPTSPLDAPPIVPANPLRTHLPIEER